MPRQSLTPSQAQHFLEQYNAGKLSQLAFRKKYRLSSSLFAYWKPRLHATKAPRPSFQELHIPSSIDSHAKCMLTLPSGAKLEFPTSHLPSALALLLGETKTSC